MKITEKLKKYLKPEDLQKFEQAISKMINEKVEILVAEKTKKIENDYAKESAKIINEKVDEKTKTLVESYDAKMEKLEEIMVENLDKFIDSEINKQISDDLLSEVAINETFKPIIEGIKNLFEEKYVDLDSEGTSVLRESKEKIENLEESHSKVISEKIELAEEVDTLKAEKVILEKTDGMTETQKNRVKELLEGKAFSEVEQKIDNVTELVLESKEEIEDNSATDEKTKENDDVASSDDGIDDEKEETAEDKEMEQLERYF